MSSINQVSEVAPISETLTPPQRKLAHDPRLRVLAAMSLWAFGPLLQKLISLKSQYLLLAVTFSCALLTFLIIQLALHGRGLWARFRLMSPGSVSVTAMPASMIATLFTPDRYPNAGCSDTTSLPHLSRHLTHRTCRPISDPHPPAFMARTPPSVAGIPSRNSSPPRAVCSIHARS